MASRTCGSTALLDRMCASSPSNVNEAGVNRLFGTSGSSSRFTPTQKRSFSVEECSMPAPYASRPA